MDHVKLLPVGDPDVALSGPTAGSSSTTLACGIAFQTPFGGGESSGLRSFFPGCPNRTSSRGFRIRRSGSDT
jgi:hypothetical protein